MVKYTIVLSRFSNFTLEHPQLVSPFLNPSFRNINISLSLLLFLLLVVFSFFYYYGILLASNDKQGTTLVLFGIIILVATVQLLYVLLSPKISTRQQTPSLHSLSHVLKTACAVKKLQKSNDYDKISSNQSHVNPMVLPNVDVELNLHIQVNSQSKRLKFTLMYTAQITVIWNLHCVAKSGKHQRTFTHQHAHEQCWVVLIAIVTICKFVAIINVLLRDIIRSSGRQESEYTTILLLILRVTLT